MKVLARLTVPLILAAAAIRLAGINCQLWLDEIWSIRLAQKAGFPLGVFTNPDLKHDNNHWLNTLYLLALGAGRPFWVYHLLPEVTGIGTVILGYLLARKRGPGEGFCAVLLLGFCEFLIEYSSDARGYAPAGFFTLLGLFCLEKHLAQPRRVTALMMSAAGVLGVLSHLTFAVILAALGLASLVALIRQKRAWVWPASQAMLWWAVPVTMLAMLYFVDVRHMVYGGGPPTPSDFPSQAAAMILGISPGSWLAPLLGLAALVLCAAQLYRLYRANDAAFTFYLVVFLFVPGVLFLWPKSDYLHPRYVYVAVPPLLVLMAMELGGWLAKPQLPRFAAAALLAAFVLANVILTTRFLRLGRGDFTGALAALVDQTANPNIVVAANEHPKSTLMVLQYYDGSAGPRLKPHRLLTLNTEQWGDHWPQWMIAENDYGLHVDTPNGVPFVRRGSFPKGAVTSGIAWTLYEVESRQPNVRPENLKLIPPQ
jgi:hypothetical protein